MSSGYHQGGFAPPQQGGYPGPPPGFGPQGVPPRPPAAPGGSSVPPVVIWIILGITALNLILTSVIVVKSIAAENRIQEQLDSLPSVPDFGDLGGLGGSGSGGLGG